MITRINMKISIISLSSISQQITPYNSICFSYDIINSHCMEKSSVNIELNVSFCVSWKKICHIDMKNHAIVIIGWTFPSFQINLIWQSITLQSTNPISVTIIWFKAVRFLVAVPGLKHIDPETGPARLHHTVVSDTLEDDESRLFSGLGLLHHVCVRAAHASSELLLIHAGCEAHLPAIVRWSGWKCGISESSSHYGASHCCTLLIHQLSGRAAIMRRSHTHT